jgi:hypothetical protein
MLTQTWLMARCLRPLEWPPVRTPPHVSPLLTPQLTITASELRVRISPPPSATLGTSLETSTNTWGMTYNGDSPISPSRGAHALADTHQSQADRSVGPPLQRRRGECTNMTEHRVRDPLLACTLRTLWWDTSPAAFQWPTKLPTKLTTKMRTSGSWTSVQ